MMKIQQISLADWFGLEVNFVRVKWRKKGK